MLGNSVQYSGMKHANYKSLILLLFLEMTGCWMLDIWARKMVNALK